MLYSIIKSKALHNPNNYSAVSEEGQGYMEIRTSIHPWYCFSSGIMLGVALHAPRLVGLAERMEGKWDGGQGSPPLFSCSLLGTLKIKWMGRWDEEPSETYCEGLKEYAPP